MNKDKIYIQAEGCLLEQMDEDSLLFNPHTSSTLHLNSSSALVWTLCDGTRSVTQLISELRDQFPGQAGQIADDVNATLSELKELGVIRERD